VLSLDKESYERLGVEGRPSTFRCNNAHKKHQRFLVDVDLNGPAFVPCASDSTTQQSSDRLYARLQWCFGLDRMGNAELSVVHLDGALLLLGIAQYSLSTASGQGLKLEFPSDVQAHVEMVSCGELSSRLHQQIFIPDCQERQHRLL